ncbi:MAG: sporulation protein YqfD [Oscillibacter sp.]|nr:sporulation protein YqfD [Oscillibacter sp.]
MSRAVNYLRGQVLVRVESAFPERVLNLCAARDLGFWDLQWESETAFTCRLSRADFRELRRAAGKLECSVTPLRRSGAPYTLRRLLSRPALAAGAVAVGLWLVLGSFFIWEFTIEGNETLPDEVILRALEEQGVGIGSFGLSLDGEDLRNRILLELPELVWLTVNVSGCRASVQVRERVPVPETVDRKALSNLVARRAGLVLEIHAFSGVKCVVEGMSVEEGQILISGVEDTENFGARTTAGLGEVKGRTWHTLTAKLPLTVQKKVYAGEKTGYSLIFGKKRVKFFGNSSIEGRNYDKITKRMKLSFLGVPLPVTVEQEKWQFFETQPAAADPAALEELGRAVLEDRLHREVEPYGTVSSSLCTAKARSGTLEVTLRAECEESIGELAPILLETP